MRSVTDLLRTYNFVNTPEGRRSTVRFCAGLLVVAAGGFMVFFIAFGGGHNADSTYESSDGDYGPREGEAFHVAVTSLSTSEYYVGYPTALYDPDDRHLYSEGAIERKLETAIQDYGWTIKNTEPITSPDEHEVLLGYRIELSALSGPLGPLM